MFARLYRDGLFLIELMFLSTFPSKRGFDELVLGIVVVSISRLFNVSDVGLDPFKRMFGSGEQGFVVDPVQPRQ